MRGERPLFSDITFALRAGALLQLTGPNGSGKTSLLRIIAGLLAPESGEVLWEGANIRSLDEEYFTQVTYVGHRNGVKEELSSLENLRISSGLAGFEVNQEQAKTALSKLGLAGREDLPVRFLSEGQRRRSALARLITGGTSLWLLDEVFASLDQAARALIESVITEHLSHGGTAVVATHHELNINTTEFQRLDLATAGARDSALGWRL